MSIADREKLLSMRILIVDDETEYLEIFATLLAARGYINIRTASNGRQALEILRGETPVDLVLSDLHMPELGGYELLETMKGEPNWRDIPVIMISATGQLKHVINCIRIGAEDYLSKPVEKELLWARVKSSLERKFLRDNERELYRKIQIEKDKSERVLYNVIPRRIADRLRQDEVNISESINSASIVFADMVEFTTISSSIPPEHLVSILNQMFLSMDILVDQYGMEKIKTVGDCYMCVAGLDFESRCGRNDHADRSVAFARAAIECVNSLKDTHDVETSIRVGIASGPLVAGVIGRVRPMYDVWGQTVNLASRMESHGIPNHIQITESTYDLLKDKRNFEPRSSIEIKGVGKMRTYVENAAPEAVWARL